LGVDTLIGGAGNDTYTVDTATDVITELTSGGTDTVNSSVSHTLGDNLENLTLTGTADLNGTGTAGNNTILGNSGTNTLIGGAGDDTYGVDNATDVVTELAGEGTDTVNSAITYTLGDNVENLTLTGTADINGTGNALNNTITGNAGANSLDGGAGDDTLIGGSGRDELNGGTGADTLMGGLGNDDYDVQDVGDVVTEAANEGHDTVRSTINYTLGDNVEDLIFTGTGNLSGTGNALNNFMQGNNDNNTFDGGLGADVMQGLLGDDTYTVDDANDVIVEDGFVGFDNGTDTVIANITYTLGDNLENLILTGTTDINGTGNTQDNTITGNTGNNTLDGGAGFDTAIISGTLAAATITRAGDTTTITSADGVDVLTSIERLQFDDQTVANVENPIPGADILVTTFSDVIDANDGLISLREAVITANAATQAITIGLAEGTYSLSNNASGAGDLNIHGNVTIRGAEGVDVTIQNGMLHGAFEVHSGAQLALEGLTIDGGGDSVPTPNSSALRNSSALLNSGGTVSISETIFQNNRMPDNDNIGTGGKVGFSLSPTQGGAIFNASGSINIDQSQFNNNQAGFGGAISAQGGQLTIDATTFDGNIVPRIIQVEHGGKGGTDVYIFGDGAAIYSTGNAQINILANSNGQSTATTFTNSTGTDIVAADGSTINLDATIVATTTGVTQVAASNSVNTVGSSASSMTEQNAVLTLLAGLDISLDDLGNSDFALVENAVLSQAAGEIVLQLANARLVSTGSDLAFAADPLSLSFADMIAAAAGTVDGLTLQDVTGTTTTATLTGVAGNLSDVVTRLTTANDTTEAASIGDLFATQVAQAGSGGNDTLVGTAGADTLTGGDGDDNIEGRAGADRLLGEGGNDTLMGGDGADILNGGDGDDFIFGGATSADLRDVVFAGAGNDSVDGGYGNDEISGQDGNDTIAGGFGSDTLNGQNGDDVITGSALSDLVSGNAGNDFVNGGFGHDRINGGSGADRFFHLGILDHGSDFIQDYNAAEGDVLLSGIAGATRADFQVNIGDAIAVADGEKAGDDDVQEAFVIYRPTEQILWALIDGAGQSEINIRIGGTEFDLLV
jgi:Ca2+-binding RTX toxin-like protein